MKKYLITLFAGCVYATSVYAQQPQYTIDIDKQQQAIPNTGFLKMGTNTSPTGDVLSYNNSYLIKNGKPWFPVMGEMHFSRCAEKDWEESIMKMKAAGIEVISTYVFWNHHEETEGVFDWTGNRNIHKFLSLCHKHGMYVWLRPGPWIHAEARNGGFPDWLMNKQIELRKNDPDYLAYAKKWFDALAKQCDGFLFKQNGTIIGIQVENELVFKQAAAYQHMKTLKQLTINAGFDVPYYSAFAQGPDDQDEFLYTIGGYPDSPWSPDTRKLYKPVYYIKPLEADRDIGSDLFGKVDGRVRNTYPKLSAELGGGMQKTYHRRVDVSSADIGALAFTRVASGINGMGYFMFHGGQNPVGKTSLQESRASNYPNDLPYINYDFQAPIGAMGIIGQSYGELRMLNLFLQDFVSELAQEQPYFPRQMVASPFCTDTVQSSIRIKNNTGFIFLSNYQRHVNLPAVKNFQLQLHIFGKAERIPAKPITFAANSYALWPYNLDINGAVLHYATAQPLCTLNNSAYVFFADNTAGFAFTAATISNIKSISNCTCTNTSVNTVTDGRHPAIFEITSADNRKTIIIVLSRNQALQAAKIKAGNKDVLAISDAVVMSDAGKLIIEKASAEPGTAISFYPAVAASALSDEFTIARQKDNSPFISYLLAPKKQLQGKAIVNEITAAYDIAAAQRFKDSVLTSYASLGKKYFNPKQPGPLYQLHFHDLPGQHKYKVSFKAPVDGLVKDWIAGFNYSGDVIALYNKGSLVYDQFNYNDRFNVKLSYVLQKSDKLLVQVLPFYKDYNIYVEDDMKQARDSEWLKGVLNNVKLTPVYDYKITLQMIQIYHKR